MKSFSIFKCGNFPQMESKTLEDVLREDNLFGGRELRTSFRLISDDYCGFEYFDVEHTFQQLRPGRTLALVKGEMSEVKFSEYLEDIVFPAYLKRPQSIMVFGAKKEIAQDVYKNIQSRPGLRGIDIEEKLIDFEVLEPLVGEYKSVWFSGMKSGGLHSASLSGTNLKEHPHFIDYKNTGGKVNYVTIPFLYDDAIHPIGITKESGVVLQQKYDNVHKELELVEALHKELISKAWDIQDAKTKK